jgi:electron transfer flavoprotein alpha/beta subunit
MIGLRPMMNSYWPNLLRPQFRKQPQPFDLILTGKTAIDADAGQLGPALAELPDLPHVGAVVELTASESQVKATRRVEGAVERFEGALPLLITCEKGLVEPRYPSLPNLMKPRKSPSIRSRLLISNCRS